MVALLGAAAAQFLGHAVDDDWSASCIAVGFGLLLGLVVGWSRTIYRGLYPVMIGFNSIPKVAVVPILVCGSASAKFRRSSPPS